MEKLLMVRTMSLHLSEIFCFMSFHMKLLVEASGMTHFTTSDLLKKYKQIHNLHNFVSEI